MIDLEAWIKEDAARITEEIGFEWEEIPGAIAWAAVMRLIYERESVGLTLDTTLREVGERLGMEEDLI